MINRYLLYIQIRDLKRIKKNLPTIYMLELTQFGEGTLSFVLSSILSDSV